MTSLISDVVLGDAATLLGHDFNEPALLARALTHPSASETSHYQRLEFLGDRVLGLVIATWIYRDFPDEAEGALNRRLAALVRRETLAEVARETGLDRFMVLNPGAESEGVRGADAVLADIAEAAIGALYLDGGLEPAENFIHRHWAMKLEAGPDSWRDAKTALQQWAQGRGLPLPDYEMIERSGPDHNPLFTIRVSVTNAGSATGSGGSKRSAEQEAAARLLRDIGIDGVEG